MNSRDLYDALARLGTTTLDQLVYRHVAPEYDCHSGEGASIRGGRWNPDNGFQTIYTALSRETAAAELYRFAARSSLSVRDFLPRKLCVLHACLASVVDLRSEEALSTVELSLEDVTDPDWTACRTVGAATYKFGLEGLLVPSATGVGEALVIFPLNMTPDSSLDPLDPEVWTEESDLPAI